MTTHNGKSPVDLITKVALRIFLGGERARVRERARPKLLRAVRRSYLRATDAQKKVILDAVLALEARKIPRAPPVLVRWLSFELGGPGLVAWAIAHHPKAASKLGADALLRLITDWTDKQKPTVQSALLKAGVRYGVGVVKAADEALIRQTLGQLLSDKEEPMATTFRIDPRGLPANFIGEAAYVKAVLDELVGNFGMKPDDQITHVAVTGLLLLNEQFDPKATGFTDAVEQAWRELLRKTKDYAGNSVPNREIFKFIIDNIPTLPGRGGNTPVIFYQEVGSVGRFVIKGATEVPLGHPNFLTQVRLGLDNYVAGTPLFDSLELPPLTGDGGTDVEVEADNVRAVALVYAAQQLEEMRMFGVVDRITELFYNGLLPIGFDAGGRSIDNYYWDREDRMKESERRMIYSRVLGTPGGDVAKEVQPNTQFEGLFMRFLGSLAEYDRQQRISDIIERRRPQNLTAEYVRKAGRDLAANLSLYGWGGTHFAARRLNNHIATALDILKQPSIQKAYGVNNPYQLIERVCATEFNFTPNVVKHRTMADSGKKIMDIVAKYAKAWSNTGSGTLFEEPVFDPNNQLVQRFDIPKEDRDQLILQTQYWLAVNGIKDDQVDKLSEPEVSVYAPSIPSIGHVGANGKANGGGNDGMERIKQMVSQGQVPSLDQLQQIITGGKVGV
jgi:hypothetical protein